MKLLPTYWTNSETPARDANRSKVASLLWAHRDCMKSIRRYKGEYTVYCLSTGGFIKTFPASL
jgi:hypothetical protein